MAKRNLEHLPYSSFHRRISEEFSQRLARLKKQQEKQERKRNPQPPPTPNLLEIPPFNVTLKDSSAVEKFNLRVVRAATKQTERQKKQFQIWGVFTLLSHEECLKQIQKQLTHLNPFSLTSLNFGPQLCRMGKEARKIISAAGLPSLPVLIFSFSSWTNPHQIKVERLAEEESLNFCFKWPKLTIEEKLFFSLEPCFNLGLTADVNSEKIKPEPPPLTAAQLSQPLKQNYLAFWFSQPSLLPVPFQVSLSYPP